MRAAAFSISPRDLWNEIGVDGASRIVDVRRRDIYQDSVGIIPGSTWYDPEAVDRWITTLGDNPVVAVCKAGHELSQMVAARLRESGIEARILAGGYAAWSEAALPLASKAEIERLVPRRPSLWVTRRRPKIDRIACPWLVRRFIDPRAHFLFVDPPEVPAVARESGAVPFDIEGVELSHDGERCSFDAMLKVFGLESDPVLSRLALIVRGADTFRHDLAPQAAGLHAISLGLSALAGDDDHALLRSGFMIYDGLLAWLRHASDERHNWSAKAA